VQQVQEVPADRIVVGLDLDALASAAEVVPVEQHRAERRHQPVGDVFCPGQGMIAFSGSTVPSADTPVRITSIGCAEAGTASSAALTACGSPRSPFSFAL